MKLFSLTETAFENFDSTVRKYLSKTFNSIGYQYTHSQLYGIIFDAIKGVMQNALFYVEDALNEQNIITATRRKSIYSLAKISGYEPYYGSAASGTIIGKGYISNALDSGATKIYINNYTKIINDTTGITYTLFLNTNRYVIDIESPLVEHQFKIVQGAWTQYQYSFKGEALETISVDASGLFDKEYMEVYVNGEKYSPVSSLYDMSYDSKEYVLSVGYENIFDIMFGNGIYGRIPDSGSVITIKYLSHSGVVGNINTFDSPDFKFLDTGYDSFENSVNLNNYIKLSFDTVISGGTDSDSIEFVQKMIGANSRSNVLASEDNFKLFFKRFSFIGHVNCWSTENTMTIYATCISNILSQITDIDQYYKITSKITNPNGEGIYLSNEQKNMVINTLKNSNKSFAGMTLKFQDPEIRRYSLFCYVKPKSDYSKSDIEESLRNVFARYFMSLPENCDFIPKSDLVQLGANVHDDILSFDVDIVSELAENTYIQGYNYKYVIEYIDGQYQYIKKRMYYEKDTTPGIDSYGNIQLSSNLEIPILGGFRYYIDKENGSKDSVPLNDAVQIVWI